MELTPTGTVILGFLSGSEMSGYDIKTRVDESTRFFWAASYGQIYPELKRLAEAGLIEPSDQPGGERGRIAYRITGPGLDALRAWLLNEDSTMELRHEGMLKLFFADALPRSQRVEMVRAMAELHRGKADRLRLVQEAQQPVEGDPSWLAVLRFGLGFNQWAIEWCDAEIARLEAEAGDDAGGDFGTVAGSGAQAGADPDV
jgi:DNA-binding PadR family transcriptional regulator